MRIKVDLVIVTVDWQTGTYYVLSKTPDVWTPPQTDKVDVGIPRILRELFSDHTNLSPNWVTFEIRDVQDQEAGVLRLVYSVVIPYKTELKGESYWIVAMNIPNTVPCFGGMRKAIQNIG